MGPGVIPVGPAAALVELAVLPMEPMAENLAAVATMETMVTGTMETTAMGITETMATGIRAATAVPKVTMVSGTAAVMEAPMARTIPTAEGS
jgi:hypothetical protein